MSWKDCCRRSIFTFSPNPFFWTIDPNLLLFYHFRHCIFPTWNDFVVSKNEIKWFEIPVVTSDVIAVWPISFPKEFYCSSRSRSLSSTTWKNSYTPIFGSVVFVGWNWFRVFLFPFWIFFSILMNNALFFIVYFSIVYFSFCWSGTGFNFFVSSCFKEF